MTALQEYEGKKFTNVSDGSLDLESEEEKEATKKVNEDNEDLLKAMRDEIKEVKEVRFSNKLKTHPVCLTTPLNLELRIQFQYV
jgi:molecular chaperone HtpG